MNLLVKQGWQTFALLISLIGYAQASTYQQDNYPPYLLSLGHGETCVKDDHGVKCWGKDWGYGSDQRITAPDSLGEVTQLSMGNYHACALDENGVTCWGSSGENKTTPPDTLTNPEQIFSGKYANCALDAPEGEAKHIECWGSGASDKQSGAPVDVSTLKHLDLDHHVCMVDDNGVTCWGANSHGQASVPSDLINPLYVTTGAYHTCALDQTETGNEVRCWGSIGNPPALDNPIYIEAGSSHTCALEGNRKNVKCWGAGSGASSRSFDYVHLMGSAGGHNCVINGGTNTLSCWGDGYYSSGFPSDLSFVDYDNDGVNNEEDAFNTNPKASVDADNDGLPDDCIDEECGGLTQDPSLNDTDNDGLINELDDVVGDNNPPVVLTIPGEGNVAASENGGAQLTINPPLNLLSAEDFVSDQLTWQVTVDEGEPQAVDFSKGFKTALLAGPHVLAWQAIDEAGNVSEANKQIVNIYPGVKFTSGETFVKEGETLTVEVSLAGISPIYPITFDLAIDFNQSTINAEDLDGDYWLNGANTFEISESGKTQVVIKTVNNIDSGDEEILKLNLTNPKVLLNDGTELSLVIALPAQHSVYLESVENVEPTEPTDGRDTESGSSGGSGGGSTTPMILLALVGLMFRRRVR